MQRKNIEVGKTYAVGSGMRDDRSIASRIRILAVGPAKTIKGKTYWVGKGGYYHPVSGIIGIQADVPFDGVLPADADIANYGNGGTPFWIQPRDVWATWPDWETLQGQRQVREGIRRREEEERIIQQQAEIDHMRALVPEADWAKTTGGYGRPLEFAPGATPRITVADLTLLLKAARTAALNEAFGDDEPDAPEGTKK